MQQPPKNQSVPIQYVGLKPERPDTVAGTGLIWKQGGVHLVDARAASKLLQHPDIWAISDAPITDGGLADVVVHSALPEKAGKQEQDIPPPLVDINSMTRPQLLEFAMRQFGVDLPDRAKKEELQDRVRNLMEGRRLGA